MKKELSPFLDLMKMHENGRLGSQPLYKGVIQGHSLMLGQSGIGKINATIATTLMISQYSPDCVINIGVGGALGKGLTPGDIVLSSEVAHNDVDVRPFNYLKGQVPGLPARYKMKESLVRYAEQSINKTVGLQSQTGLIISGDTFIHTVHQIEEISRHFPDGLAVDMESAAIAQTCYLFKTPLMIIRSISDIPGGGNAPDDFNQFLESSVKNLTRATEAFIRKIVIETSSLNKPISYHE